MHRGILVARPPLDVRFRKQLQRLARIEGEGAADAKQEPRVGDAS